MANTITLFRLVIAFPVVLLILGGFYWTALILTLLAAVSDLIDGRVARHTKNTSDLGKVIDPLADKIFVLSVLIALVDVGRVSSVPVVLLFFREISITFLRSAVGEPSNSFGANWHGKLKTILEFVALSLILLNVGIGELVLWLSVFVAYLSAYQYIRDFLKSPSGLNYP